MVTFTFSGLPCAVLGTINERRGCRFLKRSGCGESPCRLSTARRSTCRSVSGFRLSPRVTGPGLEMVMRLPAVGRAGRRTGFPITGLKRTVWSRARCRGRKHIVVELVAHLFASVRKLIGRGLLVLCLIRFEGEAEAAVDSEVCLRELDLDGCRTGTHLQTLRRAFEVQIPVGVERLVPKVRVA